MASAVDDHAETWQSRGVHFASFLFELASNGRYNARYEYSSLSQRNFYARLNDVTNQPMKRCSRGLIHAQKSYNSEPFKQFKYRAIAGATAANTTSHNK